MLPGQIRPCRAVHVTHGHLVHLVEHDDRPRHQLLVAAGIAIELCEDLSELQTCPVRLGQFRDIDDGVGDMQRLGKRTHQRGLPAAGWPHEDEALPAATAEMLHAGQRQPVDRVVVPHNRLSQRVADREVVCPRIRCLVVIEWIEKRNGITHGGRLPGRCVAHRIASGKQRGPHGCMRPAVICSVVG